LFRYHPKGKSVSKKQQHKIVVPAPGSFGADVLKFAEQQAQAFAKSELGQSLEQNGKTSAIISQIVRKYGFPLTKTGFHCAARVAIVEGFLKLAPEISK
jgi:hypothetical protein